MRTLRIVNQSVQIPPPGWARTVDEALHHQLHDVAAAWSEYVWKITEALHSQAFSIRLVDDLPEAPGALAYHDNDADGPFIRVGLNTIQHAGGGWYDGPLSIPSVISHEVCELVGDPTANRWTNDAQGVNWATELCDAVESDWYSVTTADGTDVSLSNFLLPAYFNPFGAGKLDFMGVLRTPFEIRSNGYAIREEGGNITQVFGRDYPDARKPLKHRALERAAYFPGATVTSVTL